VYVMLIYMVAAAVLQWIDKRVVEALKASLAERTVVQYSSQVTQFLLFVLWAVWNKSYMTSHCGILCRLLCRLSMRLYWLSVERAIFNGPHVRSTGPAFFYTARENNAK
jgi:hypothetical protein